MPTFATIPDWFSWTNQGAGIAVADFPNRAAPDLVVLTVDSPGDQNRGLFRVGASLDATGAVTGGWTPWAEVPDWFSHDNQGAGIAVADIEGSGGQDLVVAMVDNAVGPNQGLYRIGRGLDPTGAVTGGWSCGHDPGWCASWENQGVAVTVTTPDGQGRRDLVVFTVDDGPELNRGSTASGSASPRTGRSPPGGRGSTSRTGSPGRTRDAGWLSRTSTRTVAVTSSCSTSTTRWGRTRRSTGLGATSARTGSRRRVGAAGRGVPNWFSWENQGGGIAVTRLGGAGKLVALLVDAPPEQNAGLFEVLDLDPDPARDGSWELLPFHSGVLAVHAALLPTGDVLFFAGSGSSAVRFASPLFGDEAAGIFTSVVWDPPGNTFRHPATLRTAAGQPFDFFCGGDAFLSDGRMLSAGGTLDYDPFKGRKDVAVFDPSSGQWAFAAAMANGRWYPTLIPLGDGRILATTGLTETGDDHNDAVEFFDPTVDAWTARQVVAGFPGLPLYAHLFLLADGRVFFSGGRMDDPLDVEPCLLDIAEDPIPAVPVPDLLDPDMRNQSASVLLPPAQDQRVLIAGGGPVGKADRTDATDAVSVIDLQAAAPRYAAAAPMALPRLHLNAVILPDHTVFVSGGSLKQEDEPLARLEAEIYDPGTDRWSVMAAATIPRLYHSTALLLPDGRVVAAGRQPRRGVAGLLGTPRPAGGDAARGLQPAVPVPGAPAADHHRPRARHLRPDPHHHHSPGRADPLGLAGQERGHHPLLRQRPTARRPRHRRPRRQIDRRRRHGEPQPRSTRLVHALPRRPAGHPLRRPMDTPDVIRAMPPARRRG